MSLHAARGRAHEDLSWNVLGRRAARDVMIVGDRGGEGRMRKVEQGPAGAVRVDEASSASIFRELDDAFLQKQTKIWLGEVLHLRFDEDVLVADLLADGELLFQVSKVLWKRLLKKNREQLKQSKVYIYERLSFGRSNGKYMPYSKVDSFLKICQILGLAGIDLFTPSDVVEKRNVRKVCICIRSVSKKSHVMRLNVPDFDIVTYTISMPNYIVGGILRSLEQPQYSSSGSSGYNQYDGSKALQQQQQNDEHGDTHYDSDEAESRLSVLEPEDSVDEDNLAAVLSQLGDAPNEENEGYGAVLSQLGDAPNEENEGYGAVLSQLGDAPKEENEDYGALLSQLGDAPKEENEGYGESGHDMHGEKSLAESVGSLNFGIMDSYSVDSTPQNLDKESDSTHSATDQCSRTRTAKCSLSSEESDSISSNLVLESGNNDSELNSHHFADLERTSDVHVKSLDHSTHGNGETLAVHPKKECAGTINHHCDSVASAGTIDHHCDALASAGTINHHCDALAYDMESVCSSCEESRYGLSGEPSDLSSESYSGLTPTHTMGRKLPMVSEDPVNNIEPSMTGMTIANMSEELNPEFSDGNQMEGSEFVQSDDIAKCIIPLPMQEGSKFEESDDVAKCSIPPQRPEDDAPKSGKGVLKSVAGGITLVGAVFFMVHLRRSKERSFTRVIPSLSEKSIQSNSTAKSMDKENVPDVYPGAQLKV